MREGGEPTMGKVARFKSKSMASGNSSLRLLNRRPFAQENNGIWHGL